MNAKNVVESLKKRFPNEPEYIQAVQEVLETIEDVYNQHPEFEKANLELKPTAWSFDAVVDAIAKMDLEAEDGLFLLISPADQAKFRKALKDDLKYSEGFVRTGYIGSVCGVPVIVSKAVPADKGYLATKDAVTVFIKKDTEVEQDRNPDTRDNKFWIRKVAVVALTDATKAVKITLTPGV